MRHIKPQKAKPVTLWVLLAIFLLITSGKPATGVISPQKNRAAAVAIFVDSVSYQRVGEALHLYRDAVESDELSAYILVDSWKDPAAIRDHIRGLLRQKPGLEGIVLVGDIPIPMILDAQHLTSAFKIDQDRFPKIRTAVPSDRFYDDLDLKFNFIEQDTANSLLFYYSLSADSPQKIESEIYSGRIKPPVEGDGKYEALEKYLRRVAASKRQINRLDHALVVSGHGYHSESLAAWAGELQELREHFPVLFQPGGNLVSLYHRMNLDLKKATLLHLQQPELDLAIFHAHGDDDMQYLSGLPEGSSVQENIEAVKYYLRGKLRQAKRRNQSLEATMADFREKLDVPESWFAGAFVDSVIAADSLLNYGLDIHVADIRQMSPQAEFIIHDQCFNGAFIHSPYIAGEYVFGNGTTIAAAANTVNIIQDLWAGQNLGILALGARVGFWNQQRHYLETHLIGDPTFRFTRPETSPGDDFWKNRPASEKFWQGYLSHHSPALRAYAVQQLFRLKKNDFERQARQIYQTDPSFIVRLQSLRCLAELRMNSFPEILKISVYDPFELIRRFTVKWMGDSGREEFLPYLVENIFIDPARRVNSNARDAISKIGSAPALALARQQSARFPAAALDDTILQRFASQARSDSNWIHHELLPNMSNDTLAMRKRISATRTFRYYRFQAVVPFLLQMLQDREQPEQLTLTIAEALGWYGLSDHRASILRVCRQRLAEEPEGSAVASEIRKTIRRLESGPNNVLTP